MQIDLIITKEWSNKYYGGNELLLSKILYGQKVVHTLREVINKVRIWKLNETCIMLIEMKQSEVRNYLQSSENYFEF